jgi:hypothetical protein
MREPIASANLLEVINTSRCGQATPMEKLAIGA